MSQAVIGPEATARTAVNPAPLLEVTDLKKHFPVTEGVLGRVTGQVRAVDGVSFSIAPGETLGMVGESGCGKTTIGRCILRLLEPNGGSVKFQGQELLTLGREELRAARRDLQIVFQDPFSSLNPRMRVGDIVAEPLLIHGLATPADVREKVIALVGKVGLPASSLERYPHEFSGGQRQRIGIARALALNPKLIVCDEAVSALDVSIQAQVINLLIDLREELGLSYLFIAHDLSVVKHVAHRIAVMYLGQLVELGTSKELFERPAHPYTQALLSAIPVADPKQRRRRIVLEGDVPSPLNPPSGCRFHPRCRARVAQCAQEEPRTIRLGGVALDGAATGDAATPSSAPHDVKCVHAYGLENDGKWHLALSTRIDEATRQNGHAAPSAANASFTGARVAADWDDGRAHTARRQRAAEASTVGDEGTEDDSDLPSLPAHELRLFGGTFAALATIALVATGHVLFAALPGLVALTALPRREAWVAALGIIAVLVLFGAHSHRAKPANAGRQATLLVNELRSYRELRGAFPSQLSDLGWRVRAVFPDGEALDPWGNPWRYRTAGAAAQITSYGPDGKASSDDIQASADAPATGVR